VNCRLFYLVGQLGAGGLERQLFYLLQRMDRERYRPAVAVWNYREKDFYTDQIRTLGVPLHALSCAPSAAVKFRTFRRMVRQLAPEVVHSYSFYTNCAGWWATLGTRAIPIGAVQSDFTWDRKSTGPLLGRLSARWPRSQIFNSFAAFQSAQRSRNLFVPKQVFVVRNGMDLQRFRTVPLSTKGQVRVVGVGSLLPVKRWDRLLGVAQELKRNGCECTVQIAGDGPLRGPLKQQSREMGLEGYVEFLGNIDDIPGLLSDATFLVHTSDTEGCPNVVMEAMACGRAVVATDAGDVPDLVDNGITGFVVRRGDNATLVDRVVGLIADRDLCRRMGEAGRAKAVREFGFDRLVAETLAAYRAAGWKE